MGAIVTLAVSFVGCGGGTPPDKSVEQTTAITDEYEDEDDGWAASNPKALAAIEVIKKEGQRLCDSGDDETGIACFTEAIRLCPDLASTVNLRAEMFFLRGRAYDRTKKYKLSLADHSMAIELNSDVSDYLFRRGMAHWRLDDEDKAVSDISNAIRLDPENALAYYGRAFVYGQIIFPKGRGTGLVRKNTTPQSLRAANFYGFPAKTEPLTSRESFYHKRILRDLDQAIRFNPEDAVVFNFRGQMHYFVKAFGLAAKDFLKASELDPEVPQYEENWRSAARQSRR